jgi:predicted alpha/beta-fold hydrolase
MGLRFADVSFPSRDDQISLKGWLIPGVLPDGRLTVDRMIVAVHGTRTNRESPNDHLMELTGALARNGFGVLGFDMRGMGESPPAPLSMGNLEQRDVLGAVDFPERPPALSRAWAAAGDRRAGNLDGCGHLAAGSCPRARDRGRRLGFRLR